MEARVGIEPTYKGFADLSLTTWVPRRNCLKNTISTWIAQHGAATRVPLKLTAWLVYFGFLIAIPSTS